MRVLGSLLICLLGMGWADAITCGQESCWESIAGVSNVSLRGLHVLDSEVVWASGASGTILHTHDGGETWRSQVIPGAELLDIRDLHVFDRENVLAMTSGTPARLYRTSDGGENWKLVFESNDPRVFLDSVSFLDDRRGLVMGDPVDERLYLLHSTDAGWNWSFVENTPQLQPGEAGFAASGTNMTVRSGDFWVIGLGGGIPEESGDGAGPGAPLRATCDPVVECARVVTVDSRLAEWRIKDTPLSRHASGGIFSMVYFDSKNGVAIGGDYKQPDLAQNHIILTIDGGETWEVPDSKHLPSGFRSCVAVAVQADSSVPLLIAVGTNGTDISGDYGRNWRRVSDVGFNAVGFAPDGRTGWAVGSDGRIAKWRHSR
ncbi:MAG: hypothetical protein JNL67_05465 [Planctomycetaceae bacterium]|nr:hypothetical protein [Planctomycetaceae bacterium]